ncbi:hypothetical protein VNO77_41967 [Canavalia gladiata]|uniref:Uncharacterized protein n=1 Tax=Canavalia gladiata TaxID=3824 RepID=A0AAN9JZD8_CANGL
MWINRHEVEAKQLRRERLQPTMNQAILASCSITVGGFTYISYSKALPGLLTKSHDNINHSKILALARVFWASELAFSSTKDWTGPPVFSILIEPIGSNYVDLPSNAITGKQS